MYIKSIYTGQVYKVDTLPLYGGYELATKAEYLEWMAERGL